MKHRPWRCALLAAWAGLAVIAVGCGQVGSGRGGVPDTPLPPPPPDESGCTYTVDAQGSDDAAGSSGAPWATLERALEAAGPGVVICVREGTYDQDVTITQGGSAEAPLVITGAPEAAARPVVGAITLAPGISHVRLRGLALRGFAIWGISLEGGNQDITLGYLDIAGGEAAIHMTVGDSGADPAYGPVQGVIIEDSTARDAQYTLIDCTPGPCDDLTLRRLDVSGAGMGAQTFAADGIAVERGSNILVEGCSVHDNGGDGIDLNSRDRAGHAEGIVVRGNEVYRNHLQGIKLWAGGRMENNLVWGQGINPVVVGIWDGEYAVIGNTIAFNMWDPAYSGRDYSFVAGYAEAGRAAALTLTLRDNIFAFNTGPQVGGPTGIYLGPGVALADSGDNVFYSRADGEIQAEFVRGHDAWFTQEDIRSGVWEEFSGSAGDRVEDPGLQNPYEG